MPEFQPFPKIARLNRDCTITEKIDGTNAAVCIAEVAEGDPLWPHTAVWLTYVHGDPFHIWAQSRNRVIATDKGNDNMGFAAWVREYAYELVVALGPGHHFGEWWGEGIQRGYGLDHNRFSLFNTRRWKGFPKVGPCHVAPVIYEGPFNTMECDSALNFLRLHGSCAAPGFDRPEGVVIYHHAANALFKATLEGDERPKGVQP